MKILIFFVLGLGPIGGVHGIQFDRDLDYTYEGHKNSLIDWEQVQHNEWMDLQNWKKQRAIKDQYPDWKTRLREQRLRETVGRVLECVGPCKLYRADTVNDVEFRSKIVEGDEVRTGSKGYLWIFLFDGTLVRLSPESSVTFKEINLAKSQVFHHARLNHGNIVWLSRLPFQHKALNSRETDPIFFPLSLFEANPPSPERAPEDFQVVDLLKNYEREGSLSRQVKRVNQLVEENQQEMTFKDSYTFLVMPNGTVEGKNPLLEFIVLPGEKSYFKQRLPENISLKNNASYAKESELVFRYRGYENEDTYNVVQQKWHEVTARGRQISLIDQESARRFHFGELLTKRIPTFMVARELWLKKYGDILSIEESDELARHGYRLWGVQKTQEMRETDLTLRKQFLREYTRRFETYHLNTLKKYHEKLKEQGEELPDGEYSDRFYRRAFDSYVTEGIGESRTFESDRVRLHSETRKLWKKMQGTR